MGDGPRAPVPPDSSHAFITGLYQTSSAPLEKLVRESGVPLPFAVFDTSRYSARSPRGSAGRAVDVEPAQLRQSDEAI